MKHLLVGTAVVASLAACNNTELKGTSAKLNPTVHKFFTQDDYPAASTTAKQGHAGEPQTQKFEQGEWGALDMLVVIDNSGSMVEEQTNLSTKLQPLLSKVDKSNWQIAVVTTTPNDGCQRALIKKTDANAAAKFQAAINAGVSKDHDSGLERHFFQAVNALKADCAGATKWVRPGSTLSVLVVTDEDNCHLDKEQGYGCRNLADKDGKYLTDYLSSIRTIGKDTRVYGLMWQKDTPLPAGCAALKEATLVDAVIQATSGTSGSICDADYTATLTRISSDIAQIVKYEFDLVQDPDDGTLLVTVDGAPWTKYEVTDKHVRFTEPPPFGTKVEVAYKFGAEGDMAKDFTLDKAPVAGTIKATVNGQPVDAAGLKIDLPSKRVSFAEAPAERADVKFDYKEAVKLKAEFAIDSTKVDPATLVVTVNDVVVPPAQCKYDGAKGSVTIDPPPPEGAKIQVSFKDL